MGKSSYSQFAKSILKSDVQPLYLFSGKDSFLHREALELLKKRLGPENLFFKEYEGDSFQLSSFVSDLYSTPLFEDWNLIILKKADSLGSTLHDPIVKFLDSHPASSVLAIHVDKLDQRTRFANLVAERAVFVDCSPLKAGARGELSHWVAERAGHHRKRMDLSAVDALLQLSGGDMNDLDMQIQKLAIFVKDRTEIEARDVENMVESGQRVKVFDLLDAIFEGQTGKALSLMRQLFARGSVDQDGQVVTNQSQIALQSLRLLQYRLKQLWKFAHGKHGDMAPFIRKKLEKQARGCTAERLPGMWAALLEIEFALKSSRMEPEIALEQIVLDFTRFAPIDRHMR